MGKFTANLLRGLRGRTLKAALTASFIATGTIGAAATPAQKCDGCDCDHDKVAERHKD